MAWSFMRFPFYLEGAHPEKDKDIQKTFCLGGKQSSLMDGGIDVFGKFFTASWLIDNETPR